MKNRLKRLAFILGVSMFVVCQEGTIAVCAEEVPVFGDAKQEDGKNIPAAEESNQEGSANLPGLAETKLQENVDNEAETKLQENGNDSVETKTQENSNDTTETKGGDHENIQADGQIAPALKAQALLSDMELLTKTTENIEANDSGNARTQVQAVTNCRWDEAHHGVVLFDNPNTNDVGIMIMLFKDGKYCSQSYDTHLFQTIESLGSGTYKFQVVTFYNGSSETSDFSNEFVYTKPKEKLPLPSNITFQENFVVSCPIGEHVYQYSFTLYRGNAQLIQCGSDSAGKCDFKQYLSDQQLSGAYSDYYVTVRAISSDIGQYQNSDWSGKIRYVIGTANVPSASTSKTGSSKHSFKENKDDDYISREDVSVEEDTSSVTMVVEEWKPNTPDEKKRYAVYSRESVNYTADAGNAYSVSIQNAMQGKLCYDSFESALNGYVIGRTYNIYPSGKSVYKMNSKARITLSIPKSMRADNRIYKMICVTEKGVPVVLSDLDADSDTITFETDTYYAFALVYKDTKASK